MIGYEHALAIAQDYAAKTGRILIDASDSPDAWIFGNTLGNMFADIGNGAVAVDKETGKVSLLVVSVLQHSGKKEDRELLDKYLLVEPDVILRQDIYEALDRWEFDRDGNLIV